MEVQHFQSEATDQLQKGSVRKQNNKITLTHWHLYSKQQHQNKKYKTVVQTMSTKITLSSATQQQQLLTGAAGTGLRHWQEMLTTLIANNTITTALMFMLKYL
jgi:hypothetical protein